MAEIQEHTIYTLLKSQGGKWTKQQIFEALGDDDETKKVIEEKLWMMARFGIVTIDGDDVRIK